MLILFWWVYISDIEKFHHLRPIRIRTIHKQPNQRDNRFERHQVKINIDYIIDSIRTTKINFTKNSRLPRTSKNVWRRKKSKKFRKTKKNFWRRKFQKKAEKRRKKQKMNWILSTNSIVVRLRLTINSWLNVINNK